MVFGQKRVRYESLTPHSSQRMSVYRILVCTRVTMLKTVAKATQPNISVVRKSNNIIFTLKNNLGLSQDRAKKFKPNEKCCNLTITSAKVMGKNEKMKE